jgi:glycosyltransferase family 4
MLKVLHYIYTISRKSGGLGNYMQLLAHDMSEMVELHIVTHHSDEELELPACRVHYIDGRELYMWKAKKEFLQLLTEINPDIVHVNGLWKPLSSMIVYWSKPFHYPIVLSPHGMLEPWILNKNKWLKKIPASLLYQNRALRLVDILVATSDSEKTNINLLYPNSRIEMVPNGIIVEESVQKNTWKKNKIIFFMALLRPNKGAHLLLEAVNKIRCHLNGYKIIIAGKDDLGYEAELLHYIEKHKLENLVELPGALYGESKWQMYKQADIFVLPTLNENFGLVIAEALLVGTPVITCKGAPWSDLVSYDLGWWVNRNVDDIASALLDAISLSEEKMRQMGIRGRRYIMEKYSSREMASRLLKVYMGLLSSSSIL